MSPFKSARERLRGSTAAFRGLAQQKQQWICTSMLGRSPGNTIKILCDIDQT
jgi:hypothetical protein